MVTILVLDRDAATRLAVRRALEPAGFAVHAAADKTPVAATPRLVIADLAEASLAAIRRSYPAVPVLVLGGYGEPDLVAEIVGKPFTASELLAAVRRSLAQAGPHWACATTGSRRR